MVDTVLSNQRTARQAGGMVPPQAIDVEQKVLGAMLTASDAVGRVIEILHDDDFYVPAHRLIFAAMAHLFEQNNPVDVTTVGEELIRRGELESTGGRAGLLDLAESVGSAAHCVFHARIVQDKSTLRRLIQASTKIVEDCFSQRGEVDDLLDSAESKIFSVSDARARQEFVTLKEVLPHTFEAMDRYHKTGGGISGLSTGFEKLDEMTSGLHASDLIIIAGRPSMGKTALVLNMIEHMAVEKKVPCALFSLEMSKEQVSERMLCSRARVSSHNLRRGRLREHEYAALGQSAGPLSESQILIDDTASVGVLELRAKARRMKAQYDIGMVAVDYLQLMKGAREAENRQQEIAHISRSLKMLAKELSLPVVALSQLSRQVEQRGGDRRPQLADLRESGAIEQDADLVMFVYRPERYDIHKDKDGRPLENIAEVIVGKQRNGPIGTARVAFVKEFARFENLAAHDAAPSGPPATPSDMPPPPPEDYGADAPY